MVKQTNIKNIGIEDHNYPGYQHHDGLWFEKEKHDSYYKLAESILLFFPDVKNILDIGSGAGSLSYWLKTLYNYNIITLDGNKDTINSPYISKNDHFIVKTDEEYNLVENKKTIKFDLITCFEHLEHIQEENLEKWFENLNKHTKHGSLFIGTSSTYDYNRNVHVTLKYKEWWNMLFFEHGWNMFDIMIPYKNQQVISANLLHVRNVPFNFNLFLTSELKYIKKDRINEKI